MNGLFWVLMVGVAGWLTGKLIGEEGYGEALGGYGDGLDILFGTMGALIGGYFFSLAVTGESSSFGSIAAAILGSITVVGVVRLISGRYFLSSAR